MRNAANVLVHTTAIASAKISKNLGKRRKLRKRSASFFAMPISSHPLAHWFAKPMPFYLPHSVSYIRKLYIGMANCQCNFPAYCAVFSCQASLHMAMHPPQTSPHSTGQKSGQRLQSTEKPLAAQNAHPRGLLNPESFNPLLALW